MYCTPRGHRVKKFYIQSALLRRENNYLYILYRYTIHNYFRCSIFNYYLVDRPHPLVESLTAKLLISPQATARLALPSISIAGKSWAATSASACGIGARGMEKDTLSRYFPSGLSFDFLDLFHYSLIYLGDSDPNVTCNDQSSSKKLPCANRLGSESDGPCRSPPP